MCEVIDLLEINVARKITKDVPIILKALDDLEKKLTPYKEYLNVSKVLVEVYEAKTMLNIGLTKNMKVLGKVKKDGKIENK